jgi:hypothetical protein
MFRVSLMNETVIRSLLEFDTVRVTVTIGIGESEVIIESYSEADMLAVTTSVTPLPAAFGTVYQPPTSRTLTSQQVKMVD